MSNVGLFVNFNFNKRDFQIKHTYSKNTHPNINYKS